MCVGSLSMSYGINYGYCKENTKPNELNSYCAQRLIWSEQPQLSHMVIKLWEVGKTNNSKTVRIGPRKRKLCHLEPTGISLDLTPLSSFQNALLLTLNRELKLLTHLKWIRNQSSIDNRQVLSLINLLSLILVCSTFIYSVSYSNHFHGFNPEFLFQYSSYISFKYFIVIKVAMIKWLSITNLRYL